MLSAELNCVKTHILSPECNEVVFVQHVSMLRRYGFITVKCYLFSYSVVSMSLVVVAVVVWLGVFFSSSVKYASANDVTMTTTD